MAGKEDLSFVVQAKVKEVGDDNRYEWQQVHAAEAQRQLEYWRGKEKVEWHTQGGAMQRHDEEVRKLLQDREERKEQRRKKRM